MVDILHYYVNDANSFKCFYKYICRISNWFDFLKHQAHLFKYRNKECVVNKYEMTSTLSVFQMIIKKNNSIDENKGESDLTLYWDGEQVQEVNSLWTWIEKFGYLKLVEVEHRIQKHLTPNIKFGILPVGYNTWKD